MHRRHIAAAYHLINGFAVFHHFREEIRIVLGYKNNGAETDNKSQDIEVADKARGDKHRFARFLRIRHGEEPHQDVRQAGRTEH